MTRISVHSPSFSRRRTVDKPAYRSKGGIVVSQNRVAATIGAEALKAGGNAADAAVATGLAMGIVEPWMSGIGGVGVALIHDPRTNAVEAFDFGGISPKELDPADYPVIEGKASDMFGWPAVKEDRNLKGPMSIAVPSHLAGLSAIHAAHGRMPWADLVAPAVKLAADGLVVDWYATVCIAGAFADLLADPGSKAWFLPGGVPPGQPLQNSGTLTRLPNTKLAATLAQIAKEGIAPFYHGEIAALIAADVQAAGGSLSRADLATYQVRRVKPHAIRYGGRVIHVLSELNGGPTLASAFSRLPAAAPADDASLFLGYADALDFAWRDRFARLGHAGDLGFAPERAPTSTTHFSVVDKDGMAITLTQTLLSIFGARYVLPSSGIAMNNGMNWFDPRPGTPSAIAPGARALSNYCPAIMQEADSSGDEVVAIGGAGGRKIIPAVFQLLALMEDRGLDVEAAFRRPRLDHSAGKAIVADERLDEAVLKALEAHHRIAIARPNPAPYPFTIASAVSRKGGMNTGMTDIEHPWSEAVGEDEV